MRWKSVVRERVSEGAGSGLAWKRRRGSVGLCTGCGSAEGGGGWSRRDAERRVALREAEWVECEGCWSAGVGGADVAVLVVGCTSDERLRNG